MMRPSLAALAEQAVSNVLPEPVGIGDGRRGGYRVMVVDGQ